MFVSHMIGKYLICNLKISTQDLISNCDNSFIASSNDTNFTGVFIKVGLGSIASFGKTSSIWDTILFSRFINISSLCIIGILPAHENVDIVFLGTAEYAFSKLIILT